MRMISVDLCRLLENLHGDMSYVLIRGPTEAMILVTVIELLAVKIQSWHL